MTEDRPKRESMSIDEATVSNMWEIAAIVEVLEWKGLCTKQDLLEANRKVHRRLTEVRGARAPCTPKRSNHSNHRILNTDPHSCHHTDTPDLEAVGLIGAAHLAGAEGEGVIRSYCKLVLARKSCSVAAATSCLPV